MKKFIVLILVFLPIFLMITISFAGRIFSVITVVPVESVQFVDEFGEKTTKTIKLSKNEEFEIKYRVLPEMAKNKNVSFDCIPADEQKPACTISEAGKIQALEYGYATIVVTTEEKRKSASILIHVTNEIVDSVEISSTEKIISAGDRFNLTATVLPTTAINKSVIWTSSNESKATVTQNGQVSALVETEPNQPVIITVTTVDGGFTASCKLTITANQPILTFIPPDSGTNYKSDTGIFNLVDLINYDSSKISLDDVLFTITVNNSHANINDERILTVTTTLTPIKVHISITYLGEEYHSEMTFFRTT